MTSGHQDELRAHRVLIEACLKRRVPFFWQGPGTLLISGTGIRGVLEEIKSSGEVVLGVEAFELERPDIHPRLDLIFDASHATGDPAAVTADWGEDVWLDVSLRSPPRRK